MTDILSHYYSDIKNGKIVADDTQIAALKQLELIADKIEQFRPEKPSLIKKLFNKTEVIEPITGLYMWGGVGRGKTYLMDLFFDNVNTEKKHRVHFHRFMQSIHDELKTLKQESEPLSIVAKRFSQRYKLLCLDEFNVTDITDAMLLAGLLKHLFFEGVTLVTTSNIVPDGLYKDGLQRERFIPAIALLNQHTQVFNLDAGIDYRLRTLTKAKTWWAGETIAANAHFDNVFNDIALGETNKRPLVIFQREIKVVKRAQGIAWFSFEQLCDGPRAVPDYIEMSKLFHTIIITGIPKLDDLQNDTTRRFIEFIDECYDRRVNILASAEVAADDLYTGKRLAAMFERTKSRLQEMQSQEYLGTAHLV